MDFLLTWFICQAAPNHWTLQFWTIFCSANMRPEFARKNPYQNSDFGILVNCTKPWQHISKKYQQVNRMAVWSKAIFVPCFWASTLQKKAQTAIKTRDICLLSRYWKSPPKQCWDHSWVLNLNNLYDFPKWSLKFFFGVGINHFEFNQSKTLVKTILVGDFNPFNSKKYDRQNWESSSPGIRGEKKSKKSLSCYHLLGPRIGSSPFHRPPTGFFPTAWVVDPRCFPPPARTSGVSSGGGGGSGASSGGASEGGPGAPGDGGLGGGLGCKVGRGRFFEPMDISKVT